MDRSSLLVLTYALKAKDSVGQSIQSVVTADAYVKAGVNACAALSVKNVAGLDFYGQRTEGSNLTCLYLLDFEFQISLTVFTPDPFKSVDHGVDEK